MKDKISVKGFVRVQLKNTKTGAIEGDSGWVHNAITADGFQNYIVGPIGAVAGSKTISYMDVATQTAAPGSAQTSASGEMGPRKSVTPTFSANGTLQATASWATNEATASAIGALALYNTSSAGTAASVATFASSAKTTDQTFNATYQWRFS